MEWLIVAFEAFSSAMAKFTWSSVEVPMIKNDSARPYQASRSSDAISARQGPHQLDRGRGAQRWASLPRS
jgi:hypothetical protein